MTMTWEEWLQCQEPLRRSAGVSAEQIADAEVRVGNLPPDLRALYLTTNGIVGETFEILPLFNPREPKRT